MHLYAILSIVLFATTAQAGEIYVKYKVHYDAFEVQGRSMPASDKNLEQWIGDGKLANISFSHTFIVDQKKKVAYIVNMSDKTYVESTLPLDMKKLLPPEMASMLDKKKMSVIVTPTAETRKIGKWTCRAYDMKETAMGVNKKTRVWVTKDVPIDLSKYRDMYANFLKTGYFDDVAIKEMAKIDGFKVASEVTLEMMGTKIKSSYELFEVTKKPAPPGTFAPPPGFTKKTTLTPFQK
jgi:uncharacterized protein DUF4412